MIESRIDVHESDPYADVDLAELPAWWSAAVEAFRSRPGPAYAPPRFADGALVPPVVSRLEATHDVDIRLLGVDVREGDPWEIRVDGTRVATIDRERTRDGYTRYGITADAFEELIADAVGE
ncbi:hypothetical protein [Halopenitus persicus]|uniref:Uncharacterized protein n=1 Tax=Halopenitus persicus TaxID=1048396 RepID=A0A1H3K3J1_9EURY|nr:hypothetical protein [Halopenitus persicus]SDY46315.1 hypothetical protein SAMN05216564_105231 [Halopenitus persicus]